MAYIDDVEEWYYQNSEFHVGMSVLIYSRENRSHITGMGRIIEKKWVGGIEYEWLYHVLHSTGKDAWYRGHDIEIMVMCKQEAKSYMRLVK